MALPLNALFPNVRQHILGVRWLWVLTFIRLNTLNRLTLDEASIACELVKVCWYGLVMCGRLFLRLLIIHIKPHKVVCFSIHMQRGDIDSSVEGLCWCGIRDAGQVQGLFLLGRLFNFIDKSEAAHAMRDRSKSLHSCHSRAKVAYLYHEERQDAEDEGEW